MRAMTAGVMEQESGGAVYGEYIGDQVRAQDRYQESIERRAMSVITSSSTVGALLFAFAAFFTGGGNGAALPPLAGAFLGTSLVLFALAAGAAIFVNAPRVYEGPVVDDLQQTLEEAWRTSETSDSARHVVAATQIKSLRTAKRQNRGKAVALAWAIGFEFGAIASLALGLGAGLLRL